MSARPMEVTAVDVAELEDAAANAVRDACEAARDLVLCNVMEFVDREKTLGRLPPAAAEFADRLLNALGLDT